MDKYQPEEDILYLVKTLNKELWLDMDRRLSEYDLTGVQYRLLNFLYREVALGQGTVHQNDLEKNFGLSKSTISGLVDRMAKKELIQRVNDKPYVSLVPTQKGLDIITAIKSQRNQTIVKLTRGLKEEDINQMKEDIRLLIKNIKEEENV